MSSPVAPLAQTTCSVDSMKLGLQLCVFLDMSSGNELLPVGKHVQVFKTAGRTVQTFPLHHTTPRLLLIKHISLG